MVGVRKDLNYGPVIDAVADGFLPEPTGGYPDIKTLFEDLLDKPYPPGGQTKEYQLPARKGTVQEYLRLDPITQKVKPKGATVTEQVYSKHSPKVVRKFLHMINNNGEIPEDLKTKKFSQRVLPERWPESGPTITATSLPDDYIHYAEPRSLTVREWARLQMFPDWYQFAGKRTTGGTRRAGNPLEGLHDRYIPKYTQIGNAIPVKLAYELGKHFRGAILDAGVAVNRKSA